MVGRRRVAEELKDKGRILLTCFIITENKDETGRLCSLWVCLFHFCLLGIILLNYRIPSRGLMIGLVSTLTGILNPIQGFIWCVRLPTLVRKPLNIEGHRKRLYSIKRMHQFQFRLPSKYVLKQIITSAAKCLYTGRWHACYAINTTLRRTCLFRCMSLLYCYMITRSINSHVSVCFTASSLFGLFPETYSRNFITKV